MKFFHFALKMNQDRCQDSPFVLKMPVYGSLGNPDVFGEIFYGKALDALLVNDLNCCIDYFLLPFGKLLHIPDFTPKLYNFSNTFQPHPCLENSNKTGSLLHFSSDWGYYLYTSCKFLKGY